MILPGGRVFDTLNKCQRQLTGHLYACSTFVAGLFKCVSYTLVCQRLISKATKYMKVGEVYILTTYRVDIPA